MQTYFQMLRLMQSGLSAYFSWIRSLQNVLFALCMSQRQQATSSGGPRLPRRGSLEMKAQRPSLACRYMQSMTQFFTEEWEGRQLQSHGWALPPCWVKPTAPWQGLPSTEQQQSPAWPQPCSLSHVVLRMATRWPLWAWLIPEAEWRLQSLWASKYASNRALPQFGGGGCLGL